MDRSRAAETYPPAPRRFRIEHRRKGQITVLGVVVGTRPHVRDLDPYVSRIVLDGTGGAVVVVDETTGKDVVRRRPQPPRHFRTPGGP